jgi:hypothetical protein
VEASSEAFVSSSAGKVGLALRVAATDDRTTEPQTLLRALEQSVDGVV